jgi:hypothetical protein
MEELSMVDVLEGQLVACEAAYAHLSRRYDEVKMQLAAVEATVRVMVDAIRLEPFDDSYTCQYCGGKGTHQYWCIWPIARSLQYLESETLIEFEGHATMHIHGKAMTIYIGDVPPNVPTTEVGGIKVGFSPLKGDEE